MDQPAVENPGNVAVEATSRLTRPSMVVALSGLAVGAGAGFANLVGFLAPVIRADLRVSNAAIGLVISLYFGATGVGSVAAGHFVDHVGARASVTSALGLLTSCAALAAVVGDYAALLVAAAVAGYAYAVIAAGTNVAVAAALSPGRRGLGLTLKTAGGPIVAAISSLAVGAFAAAAGWRPIIAVLGGVACVGCLLAFRNLPRTLVERARRGSDRDLPPRFLWFPVASFFFVAGAQSLFSWIVPYFQEALDVSATVAGGIASTAFGAGIVGMVASASRSDRRGVGNRVPVLVAACVVCASGELLVALGPRLGVAVAAGGAIVGSIGLLSGTGVLQAAIIDVAPHAVGRASGVALTGYYLGALISPAGFGLLADGPGFGTAWIVSGFVLLIAAVAFARCLPVRSHGSTGRAETDVAV